MSEKEEFVAKLKDKILTASTIAKKQYYIGIVKELFVDWKEFLLELGIDYKISLDDLLIILHNMPKHHIKHEGDGYLDDEYEFPNEYVDVENLVSEIKKHMEK